MNISVATPPELAALTPGLICPLLFPAPRNRGILAFGTLGLLRKPVLNLRSSRHRLVAVPALLCLPTKTEEKNVSRNLLLANSLIYRRHALGCRASRRLLPSKRQRQGSTTRSRTRQVAARRFAGAFHEQVERVEPALTIIVLSLWMILVLGLIGVVYSLVSMWKENRFGWPLRASSGSPWPS